MRDQPYYISTLPPNSVHAISYYYTKSSSVQQVQDPLQKKESQESVHIEIPVVYDSSEVNPIPIPMGSVDSATNQGNVIMH